MKKGGKIGLKPALLRVLLAVLLVLPVSAAAISPADLGIPIPGVLPSNPFYFLKKWRRNIRRTLTFGSLETARLELKILNEQAAEISKLTEILPDDFYNLEKAVDGYLSSLKKIQPTKELAGDIIYHHLKHLQLFTAIAGAFSNEERLARLAVEVVKELIVGLNELMADNVSAGEFRQLLNAKFKNDRQSLGGLSLAEAVDQLGDYRLARTKKDLLIDFLGEWIVKKHPEIILSLNYDPFVRLKILDELRLMIEDRDLKSRLSISRQLLLKKIEIDRLADGKIVDSLISEASAALKALTRPYSSATDQYVRQSEFYLKQAKFFSDDAQLNVAAGQAAMAIAAAQAALLFNNPELSDYREEIGILKSDYDYLSAGGKELEKQIIDLADFINRYQVGGANEQVERLLVDIKLKLAIARHL